MSIFEVQLVFAAAVVDGEDDRRGFAAVNALGEQFE